MEQRVANSKVTNRWLEGFGNFLTTLGLAVCILVSTIFSIGSIFVTYTNGWRNSLNGVLTFQTALSNPYSFVVVLVIFALLVGIFRYLLKHNYRFTKNTTFILVLAIVFLLQVIWIYVQGPSETSLYVDSQLVLKFGKDVSSGTFSLFDSSIADLAVSEMREGTMYLVRCPYQSGIVLFSTALFACFGDVAPTVFQIINAAANCLAIIALAIIGEQYVGNSKCLKTILFLILVAFVPFWLYCSFMYGNQIGYCLIAYALLFNVRALEAPDLKQSIKNQLVATLFSVLTIWIKPTFKIVLIALFMVWFINLLIKHSLSSLKRTIVFICCIGVAFAASSVPQKIMENILGYPLGKGEASTALIKMGLENEAVFGETMPGWYAANEADTWFALNNDYDATSEVYKQGIIDNVLALAQDPAYALWFFSTKLGTEWLVPDFSAYYFAGINGQYTDEAGAAILTFNPTTDRSYNYSDSFVVRNAGRVLKVLYPFIDAYQSFIYVFATAGLLALFRHRKEINASLLVLPCAFIIGWAVYVLWEAQAQYAIPFFMMLIPIAAYGIYALFTKRNGAGLPQEKMLILR